MKAASKATESKTGAVHSKKKGGAAKQAADAEKLLKADHRKVEKLFTQYKTGNDGKKVELIKRICSELIVHTKLEEELFYPACREMNVEDSDLDEAQVEHDGAKVLIAELINCSPEDDYIDAKVTVLSEYIKHHVGEEEEPSEGIFAKARNAGVDMNALGARMQARKGELMEDIDSLSSTAPITPSLGLDLSHTARNYQEKYTMPRYPRDRDEQGRFTSDDDNGRSRGSSRYASPSRYDQDNNYNGRGQNRGYGQRSQYENDDYDRGGNNQRGSGYRERDEMGRYMSEDDDYRGRGQSSPHRGYDDMDERGYERGSRDYQQRDFQQDEEGRFAGSNRESRNSSRGYSSRSQYDNDEDRRNSPENRDWFGEPEGHMESGEREYRNSGRMTQSRRTGRDDDDDNHGSRSRSGSGSRNGSHEGHGGWYGDHRRHAEAARRGWQNR